MPNLANISECVGCTACMNVCPKNCIQMQKDLNGFLYPEINTDKCINCFQCENVCPILNNVEILNESPDAYAAFSLNDNIRKESSSGGIFSEIAKIIIEKNGVIYGAAYNKNFEVYHCKINKIDELNKLRGAKYSESILGYCFSNIQENLKSGQYVLFSGTPCQIAGLKSFLKKDYDTLFCVDFVCHGIPSPIAWKSYIKYRTEIDSNGEYPCNINLRSKETGWSNYQYSNVFQYKNGYQHAELSTDSLYMKLFVNDYISRESCENCKFKGYDRVSDFTLGDFWGVWDIVPEMDDNKGTSVVLIHSEKAKSLWKIIKPNVKFQSVTINQTAEQNQSMCNSSKSHIARNNTLEKIRKGNISECEQLFAIKNDKIYFKIKNKIKIILKTIFCYEK